MRFVGTLRYACAERRLKALYTALDVSGCVLSPPPLPGVDLNASRFFFFLFFF